MSPDDPQHPSEPVPRQRTPFHERIRSLREKQGLSGTALARRVGVRPSYISLIETGRRVPEEAMAAAIARALGDGEAEDLYRAWARAHRHGDIEGAVRGLAALRDMLSDAAMTARWASGESLPLAGMGSLAPRMRRADTTHYRLQAAPLPPPGLAAARPSVERPEAEERIAGLAAPLRPARLTASEPAEPAAFLRVPLIPEGADPGDGLRPQCDVLEILRFDPGVLPSAGLFVRPFAYRLTELGVQRVSDELRAGDLVVVSHGQGEPRPGVIHAVRVAGGVTLSHIERRGGDLLLPAVAGRGLEAIPLGPFLGSRDVIMGKVVAAIRHWD